MRARRRRAAGACSLAIALALGACTDGDPGIPASPTPKAAVELAFIEDLSVEGASHRVIPAFQGAGLALDAASLAGELPVEVELVALDTGGDPARAISLANEVAGDPGYVGAIVGPFLGGQGPIGEVLDRAGLPVLSLSALDPGISENGWGAWFRAVADQTEQGSALAGLIEGSPRARRGVCLAGDGGASSEALLRGAAAELRGHVSLRMTVPAEDAGSPLLPATVKRAGCGVIVWGGFSTEAALIRIRMTSAGLGSVILVGGDGAKDEEYLTAAGRSGEGTIVSCPCVDLSTSTDLAAQRFIQDYQAEYGSPPGIYAAEGWDVARMFVAAFRSGAVDRTEVARSLQGLDGFEGLANTYVFQADGELAPGSAVVHLYRDEGGRWIPLA